MFDPLASRATSDLRSHLLGSLLSNPPSDRLSPTIDSLSSRVSCDLISLTRPVFQVLCDVSSLVQPPASRVTSDLVSLTGPGFQVLCDISSLLQPPASRVTS
ncbi:unnamed protein product, partial [Allacma fusca]